MGRERAQLMAGVSGTGSASPGAFPTMGSHAVMAGWIWVGKGSHIPVFQKKHCKKVIVYVCLFVLTVLSKYVDKYIDMKINL